MKKKLFICLMCRVFQVHLGLKVTLEKTAPR